ncbi:hypothetical protein CVU82_01315 [Candidatus Falkowbacteria bacterium HGW-Falkowbacteria-1]|uniref:Glycosyltransferase family 1 protein n=1 Tax=Candidatus Falkowbacteria bacterium HGW-Falkowbacteria-1 TaxID=2013768 RepID=A0A2N2EAW4_9BACT|nr:MAG: hypothetical protein CVU82_01315 [Candidatus Falkowbacteria bacterium HGW-Falkowbacteria-1]
MNILILITKSEIGGAQKFVANLAQGLKEKGNKVSIASGENKGYLFDFAKSNSIDFHFIRGLERNSNPFASFVFLIDFYLFLKKNKPDVVHLNSSNALLGAISAKLANMGVKTVFTVHGLSVLDSNYKGNLFKRAIFMAFFKFCFLFVDDLVFVSQNNLKLSIKNNMSKRGRLIYNGVDLSFIGREEARRFILNKVGLNEASDVFLLGSIGRLAYPKNYEFLIENFHKIKEIRRNIKLVIIGDGPEKERYASLIKANGHEKDIILLGKIDDASKYLKAFDLFILPSIFEGLSIVLIESLLSGIKIVASNVGGNSEVIGMDNCYKLNDIDDFLRIFREKISSVQKSCTDKNKDSIERTSFSSDKMVDKYMDVYR